MKQRVIIEHVTPEIDGGRHAIKRIVNEPVKVSADIYADSHDYIRAVVRYKHESEKKWSEVYMSELHNGNDTWTAEFAPTQKGFYQYTIQAWIDNFLTWHNGFIKKFNAGQDMAVELEIGVDFLKKVRKKASKTDKQFLDSFIELLANKEQYHEAVQTVMSEDFRQIVMEFPLRQHMTNYNNKLDLQVEYDKVNFSTWYEIFPRSASRTPGQHGTFNDVEKLLPQIAAMGFDVLYMPPIHPVGKLNRKGRNNTVTAMPGDVGSPWAIGSDEGGHKAIHPQLGTLEEYKNLVDKARGEYGIDVAMDVAFQCAPDHPWIKEHPEWFIWRPDGTIAYAENPPKKYQDIVPLNFETDDWKALWEELKSVFIYWCEQGISIFRVDNPHTKSFNFWEWCIREVRAEYPDTIFLAEAFSRPRIMQGLAKLGYNQSYSYFAWRTTKKELMEYMTELTQTEMREYYRANFWPNTPDINPYHLMSGNPKMFELRYVLAATLSSNVGVYSPAYEQYEHIPTNNGKEEYYYSEKFEIKDWDWDKRTPLSHLMATINHARKEHKALQQTANIMFLTCENENLLPYLKWSDDKSSIMFCVVNLDPDHAQAGWIQLPLEFLGQSQNNVNVFLNDIPSGELYHWTREWNYVYLNPEKSVYHLCEVTVS